MKNLIHRMLVGVFEMVGYEAVFTPIMPHNPARPWTDPEFLEKRKDILDKTLLGASKLYMLESIVSSLVNHKGEIAEVGVYKGGTAKLIAELDPHSELHLFDTFEGMPAVSSKDNYHKEGDFNDTNLNNVKEFVGVKDNIHYHQGIFPGTSEPIKDRRFKFVHIDVDIYNSTRDCLEFFYPRMEIGGVLLIDDYGFLSCEGVKSAVDEFLSGKNDLHFYLSTGQFVIVKN